MARRALKKQKHMNNSIINLETYRKRKQQVHLLPRNLHQEDYLTLLNDDNKHIVFATGPAGTGKTMLACHRAVQAFKDGTHDRIVITRPAVSVDEQHGFLPGNLVKKMEPWTRPIFDCFEEYYTPHEINNMIMDNKIEVAPLAYMRGRTFKDAWIIADEMQNATPSQMKMLLTRIGTGSKFVITGDLNQHDRGYEENGLADFIEHLRSANSDMIGLVEFRNGDIERHRAVSEVLAIYNNQ